MLITRKEAESIVEIVWKHFDVNKNGYLEPEEAKQLFEFLCTQNNTEYSKELLDNLFSAIDVNGDNKITKEEVITMLVEKC